MEAKRKQIDRTLSSVCALIQLIEKLRGEGGCPWDRKQTPRSMAVYLVEETYELLDAIESGPAEDVCEELGDVWFHIFFIAALYEEMGLFNIEVIARRIKEKMTRRHPHVFGDSSVANADDVKLQWHKIKEKEKKEGPQRSPDGSVLDSIPKKTPALMRAYNVVDRAAAEGFDWNDVWEVFETLEMEI
jgi:MazG family protein